MLWNVCIPPNLYLEALMPNVMVFGNDAFGSTISQDCASCDGISGLKKRGRESAEFDLGLPAWRAVKNKSLLCKSNVFSMAAQAD